MVSLGVADAVTFHLRDESVTIIGISSDGRHGRPNF
jgi:hypothetical protein